MLVHAQLRLIEPRLDRPRCQAAKLQDGQHAIDKSLETLRTLMLVKPDVPALSEQPRAGRVRFPKQTNMQV
jgi:hypothetical protein